MFRKKPKSDPDPPSARDATLVALRPWIEAQRRPAWRPLVELGEPEAGRSKFCGSPHLMPGEDVPVCKFCGRELQLLVQVDLDRVPGDLHGSGVLQLFYCVGRDPGGTDDGHVECWAEGAWQPFSDEASLVRVVPRADLHVHAAGGRHGFPAASIVAWEGFLDLPDPEDHEDAGLHAAYDFKQRLVTLQCPRAEVDATLGIDELPVEDIASAADKDKLGGWPFWVQGPEYPSCPTCGDRMRLVLQLDSEDHVPYMFGDGGVGHITQCSAHPHVVAFGWACS